MAPILLEACVDSLDGALAAQAGGAGRVELCAGLIEGGTTPSAATIELARRHLTIGLHVMIRPRGGDFCYSEWDLAVMRRDIEIAKALGANGVVLGVLRPDASIDHAALAQLLQEARPLAVTFHRAFDFVAAPGPALETLVDLGVDRILTSGHAAIALDGCAQIAALVRQAAGRITIMAGGGINADNVAAVVHTTGVHEVHLSGRVPMPSRMRVQPTAISLGDYPGLSGLERMATSADRIRACRAALDQLP